MSAPLKVLLVDDDDITLEELGECLTGAGLSCLTALDGCAARQKIQEHDDIGVLVTDLNMPGEDGLSLMAYCNAARERTRSMKVILITGGASLGSAIEAVRQGAFDYVTKPAEPGKLIETVHRACDAAAAERASAQLGQSLAALEQERAQLAQQLDAAVRRLDGGQGRDEFLSVMSHELRTPLNPIIGFAELLRDHAAGMSPDAIRDYAADVLTAGRRLLYLVERMLRFAAIRRGELRLDSERVAVKDLLAGVRAKMAGDGLAVDAVAWPATNGGTVLGDAAMLVEALVELLANAINFGGAGIAVRVLPAETGFVEIAVDDGGPGMTPAQIARAMRPFEQLDMSMTRRIEGAGIGLPLAQQIAAGHGGGLSLLPRPEGGLRVLLRLPAA